jgi:DNA-binding MarR family transcriptional regulator
MTHQLSILQQNILAFCLEQKFITSQELLSALWDLQPQEQESKKDNIVKAQYGSAHSSLSRTLTKLWKKNLIVYWKTPNRSKTGITLTPDGQTVIQAILGETENLQKMVK